MKKINRKVWGEGLRLPNIQYTTRCAAQLQIACYMQRDVLVNHSSLTILVVNNAAFAKYFLLLHKIAPLPPSCTEIYCVSLHVFLYLSTEVTSLQLRARKLKVEASQSDQLENDDSEAGDTGR